MAKTRSQLPHLYYPPNMYQTRINNAQNFGGGGFTLGWETPVDISTVGDSIVSTEGVFVSATNWGQTATRTVNGVTFTGTTVPDAGYTVFSNIGLYTKGVISAEFEGMMDIMAYSGATDTITLTGLTVGKTYLYQAFLADQRGAVSTRNQYYVIQGYTSDTKLHSETPSFICRFVASGTTETVTLVSNQSVVLNGQQLRILD